ncbi:MAG: hypothetical protein ACYDER_18590, partial [Ktedonobacteraceae bacterium]
MRNKLVKILTCLLAVAFVWGFGIMLAPPSSAHAKSSSGFTPATGTIRIGSQVFPIVPHHPTTLHLPSSRHHSPARPDACNGGGFWIDMGDSYQSGGGYHAEADVYGLYDSPYQNAQYCGEVYCYGAGFGNPHTAPISPVSLLCTTSNNNDTYFCSLPSGGLNGSVCGMDSNTYYNTPWGEAETIVPYKVDFIPVDGILRKDQRQERVNEWIEIHRGEPERAEVSGSDESNR